jgi:hypothetical protein
VCFAFWRKVLELAHCKCERDLFDARCLLQKLPINLAVLSGNRNTLKNGQWQNQKINKHRLSVYQANQSAIFPSPLIYKQLQRTNTENLKQIFPEKKLRGHSPNFHIHVSVSDLYIPMIDLPILLQKNMWIDHGNI